MSLLEKETPLAGFFGINNYMKLYEYIHGTKYKAFWVDPKGKILPVETRHIHSIRNDPKTFGVDKDYIQKVHDKYGERLGQEGQARNEIMSELMNKGWIRLRFVDRGGSWTAQLARLGRKQKDYLFSFAYELTSGKLGSQSEHTGISIMDTKKVLAQGTLAELLSFKIFECEQVYKLDLTYITELKN